MKYITILTLSTAIVLFLFFKKKKHGESRIIPLRNFLSKYSYGIYLVHILVITLIAKVGIAWNFVNPIVAIPIVAILSLFISATIIYLINKLPLGKYISG